MTKKINLSLHIVLCLIIGSWSILNFYHKSFLKAITSDSFESLIALTIAYITNYYAFRKSNKNSLFLCIILSLSSLFLLAFLKEYRIVNSNQNFEGIYWLNLFPHFLLFIGKSFLFFLIVYSINALTNNKKQALINSLKSSQQQLLRQQFNPHFLYNAFNSLYSMSIQNNPKTSDTILKLSGMMRYLTDDLTLTKVKLSRELKFINEYIDLEEVRFGNNTNITFTFSGNIDFILIEPFTLIPFVENAFKHGDHLSNKNSYIIINLFTDDNILSFTVENSTNSNKTIVNRKGKGLTNIKNRLKLTYPKKHILKIENTSNRFFIHLIIELD
ncbi:sensor histidine kinase [Tenacibaculum sp. 190524A02b]|uniref:sensor histidine kinase n=1 Tax=Tenacibaculum vairaonense TaxID=3137860 RepID=UPI0031FA6E1B